jgi:hypothetical protein
VPYAELEVHLRKITNEPIKVVFDVASDDDTMAAGWRILAPNGDMVVTRPPTVGKAGERSESDEGKRVVFTYGNINMPLTQEFGARMYKALPKLLERGAIKVGPSLPID